jgi:hypothetical protein
MIDMRMSKKDMKDDTMPATVGPPEGPRYPYDLKICVEDDNIKALSLDDMNVGDKVTLVCDCEIVEMSKRDDEYGKKRTCRLQIQKIGNEGEDDGMTFMAGK